MTLSFSHLPLILENLGFVGLKLKSINTAWLLCGFYAVDHQAKKKKDYSIGQGD